MEWVNEILVKRSFIQESADIPISKMQENQHKSLTPTVTRVLDELGRGLWGKNSLWSKKYKIFKGKYSWFLASLEQTKINRTYNTLNCLEVYVEDMKRFKIVVVQTNNSKFPPPETCDNLQEASLKKGLIEVCALI